MRFGLLGVLLVAACGSDDAGEAATPGSSTEGTVCERDCTHDPLPQCADTGTAAECVQTCERQFADYPDCHAELEALIFCKLSQPASSFECDPVDGSTVLRSGVCASQLAALVACW